MYEWKDGKYTEIGADRPLRCAEPGLRARFILELATTRELCRCRQGCDRRLPFTSDGVRPYQSKRHGQEPLAIINRIAEWQDE